MFQFNFNHLLVKKMSALTCYPVLSSLVEFGSLTIVRKYSWDFILR